MIGKGEKKYFWVAIEGTDGVGKTFLSKKLYSYLRSHYKDKKFVLFSEFSDSKIGRLIKNEIRHKNFFQLGKNIHYPLAETLVLGADLFYQFEKRFLFIKNEKNKKDFVYIISDRGPQSFFTYQLLRIENQYKDADIDLWRRWIKNILAPLKQPDLSICLVSNIKDIKQRLTGRGDKLTRSDLEFIKNIQEEYIKLFKSENEPSKIIVENNNNNFQKTVSYLINAVKKYIN